MCGTCGCGRPDASDGHAAHAHATQTRRVEVERSILAQNDRDAARLRERLASQGIEAIGLLGGPGAGKTALLEATFARLGDAARHHAVVEGDCASDLDARRIAATGVRATQVATGAVCHLDAHLVDHALERLDLEDVSRLWIENVGNLVCPAPFACGESRRALLISTPEGDDKPTKYPASVAAVDLLVVSKADLLPHVPFDPGRCADATRRIAPDLPVLTVSAHTGAGMREWLRWVETGAL